MAKVFFILSNGKRILIQDLSSLKRIDESISIVDECEAVITKLPLNSVRLITDVTETSYDMIAIDRMKSFSKNITPFMIASAAVVDDNAKTMIVQLLRKISGRDIEVFSNRKDAIEYLEKL